MKRLSILAIACALAQTLVGCGGGHSNTGSGRALLTIVWPIRSRLIPAASNSIKATFTRGAEVVATRVLARPTSGNQTTATFDNLKVGGLTLTASAYPNADGTGVPQAQGTTPVTIANSQTANVTITMDSTVDHLEVSPQNPSVTVDQTSPLIVTAKDGSGQVVLLSSGKLQWSSSVPAVATVDGAGVITGVMRGTATISVTDQESGKAGGVTVDVKPGGYPSGDLLVTDNVFPDVNWLYHCDSDGNKLGRIDVPYPDSDPNVRQHEHVRQVDVDPTGKVQVFNGTFHPYVSTYDPTAGTWEHHDFPGWDIAGNVYYGGIASLGNFIYVSDQSLGIGNPNGIVRFNRKDFTAERFLNGVDIMTVVAGLDGKLYVATGSGTPAGRQILEIETTSMTVAKTLTLADRTSGFAVNKQGHIFSMSRDSDTLTHLDPDGQTVKKLTGIDSAEKVTLRADGKIIIGAELGKLYFTDETLTSITKITFDPDLISLIKPTFVP